MRVQVTSKNAVIRKGQKGSESEKGEEGYQLLLKTTSLPSLFSFPFILVNRPTTTTSHELRLDYNYDIPTTTMHSSTLCEEQERRKEGEGELDPAL
jgi:hypothetical protein